MRLGLFSLIQKYGYDQVNQIFQLLSKVFIKNSIL